MELPIPVASDPTESIADWLELNALCSAERFISLEALVQVIRRGGSTDAIEDDSHDAGSEVSQRVAQDAFVELKNRQVACGGSRYPFDIEQGLLELRDEWDNSAYVLLLLISMFPPTSGHAGTAALFERICSYAALGYLGGPPNGADVIHFGSPRRPPRATLSQALNHLCHSLREGGGCKYPDQAKHTGDEGLDIVAWRTFPDNMPGKLIAFGQCAGGARDWEEKLTELDSRKFTQKWFREMFVPDPLRLFFLPRRIPRIRWEHSGIDGGILFDRCRIVACLSELNQELLDECQKVTRRLFKAASRQVQRA